MPASKSENRSLTPPPDPAPEGCGLLHSLLGIKTKKDPHSHPKLGASLEDHVQERVLAVCGSADFA